MRSPDLKEFCEKAGRVRDVKLVCDRISGRSRGVAYVEFYEESSVQKAIDLTGEKLAGIPIIIELTETEKNRLAEEAAEAARLEKLGAARAAQGENGSAGGSTAKIFVGGLHPHLGETELRKVFEPFGDIEFINLSRESTDSSGPSKGFGYIQ